MLRERLTNVSAIIVNTGSDDVLHTHDMGDISVRCQLILFEHVITRLFKRHNILLRTHRDFGIVQLF